MAVNHQADILKAYFQDGSKWGLQIDYALETRPLGTMGPLTRIGDLPDHFLVLNGDILTDLDMSRFLDNHVRSSCIFTISAHQRLESLDYGVLEAGDDNRLTGFREKPQHSVLVSMGVYAVNKEVMSFIPDEQPFGFDELMLSLLQAGQPVGVARHAGYWLDIGRPEDYEQANRDLGNGKLADHLGKLVV